MHWRTRLVGQEPPEDVQALLPLAGACPCPRDPLELLDIGKPPPYCGPELVDRHVLTEAYEPLVSDQSEHPQKSGYGFSSAHAAGLALILGRETGRAAAGED